MKFAARNQFDTVIIDTSGRLQIDEEMMAESAAVKKAARADELLLVADAMTGQSAVDISKAFDEQLGLTGIILSKFDSDTRGGAALSMKSITGRPIKYIGTGEKLDALEPFFPERIASRILGMGDMVSLVEKARATIDARE
ncbi:Signal recognition particle protein [subsurface metagenome]